MIVCTTKRAKRAPYSDRDEKTLRDIITDAKIDIEEETVKLWITIDDAIAAQDTTTNARDTEHRTQYAMDRITPAIRHHDLALRRYVKKIVRAELLLADLKRTGDAGTRA